jgi:lysophospholipase L1-like esterase
MLPRPLLGLLVTLVSFVSGLSAIAAEPVRIACVGDSITAGYGLDHPGHDAWPAVLGRLLGPDYVMGNFGVSGATLLKAGDKPYWREPALAQADAFAPGIVVIKLGTNDSKPHNWSAHGEAFAADAAALIEHFARLPGKPVVWICLPAPIFANRYTIDETTTVTIRRIWRDVAAAHHIAVIDPAPALGSHPEFFPDGVHPDVAGAKALAHAVAAALKTTSPGTKPSRTSSDSTLRN